MKWLWQDKKLFSNSKTSVEHTPAEVFFYLRGFLYVNNLLNNLTQYFHILIIYTGEEKMIKYNPKLNNIF